MIDRRSFLAALLLPIAPLPNGRFVRNVPLGRFDGRPQPRLNELMGAGLDARRFTDLAAIDAGAMVTPNGHFFIRTRAATGASGATFALPDLERLVRPTGTHLIECAGNSDPANFGLMSAARWDGVPIAEVLDRLPSTKGSVFVQVTGLDPEGIRSRSSVPGASWVFRRDDLERTGAFLAMRMNGEPLPADNGFPVRLVVPGWYGCASIKWVSRIEAVADDAAATPQMIEFARRTHQDGVPQRAADYAPPVIELAATPVRVEQWMVEGRAVYRVVGIVWGGSTPASGLGIRFRSGEPFVSVSDYQRPASTTTWSLWSHTWQPASPGVYRIALASGDATVRARRLDMFFYLREVRIETN